MTSPSRAAARGCLWIAVLASMTLFSCTRGPEEAPQEVEAVDVPPMLTVDVEQDVREVPRPPELVGVLPGDFPADLPVYAPSSLVDFGTTGAGRGYVDLLSPHGCSQVAGGLEPQLRDHGWTLERGSSGSSWLTKGAARLRLVYGEANPGCEIRIEY